MKILVIPQAYPTRTRNLTPFIKENTEQLVQGKNIVSVLNVDMLALKKWGISLGSKYRCYIENEVTVWHSYMRYIRGAERINTFVFLKKTRYLYALYKAKNGKPDVILSHFSQYAGYCASIIAEEENIPHISIEHAGWILKGNISEYEKNKLIHTINNSYKMVCVSEILKNSIVKLGGDANRMIVIPNMIANEYSFHERVSKDKFVFFSAANLYVGKRIDMLVNAFCKAFTADQNVMLRIAGNGDQYNKIKEIINNYDRKNQIILLGSLDKIKMKQEYINCDCFVLPSEHETFGIVYREAMATGRPIITTNHQGFYGDLWDDSYGLRIPIDDENELIKAFVYMSENIASYDLKEISSKCVCKYACSTIMEKYLDLIRETQKID